MTAGRDIQIEDGGFTRIHNAILDTLTKANLSALEFKLVLFIIRKTYGFQKKTDIISLTQFESCGCSRRKIISSLQNLLRLKVIVREQRGQSFEYGFNKYAEEWLPETFVSRRAGQGKYFHITSDLIDTSDPKDTSTSDLKDTKTSDLKDTHKRKKETIKETPEHQKMFVLLAEVCVLDPKLKRGQIAKTAKQLVDAGYVSTDMVAFSAWWKTHDFRGQRGDPPTLAQVMDKIAQARPAQKPTKTHEKVMITLSTGERVEATA